MTRRRSPRWSSRPRTRCPRPRPPEHATLPRPSRRPLGARLRTTGALPHPSGGLVISSTKNPKVAAAARLRKRAFRDEDRRFLVEGAQGVREALSTDPPAIDTLFVADELHELAIRGRERGIDVIPAGDAVMARLTSTVTPQGIVGVAGYLDV